MKTHILSKLISYAMLSMGLVFSSVGNLQLTRGAVSIKTAEGQSFVRAIRGQGLETGDEIKTGSSSFAEIVMADNTLVRLAPNTHFTVQVSGTHREAKLITGKIWSSINKLSDNSTLNFSTPSIVAGIRGTIIRLEMSEDGSERLACEEGKVKVRGKDGSEMEVTERTQVRSVGGKLGDPNGYDPDKEERWEKFAVQAYERELMAALNEVSTLAASLNQPDLTEVQKRITFLSSGKVSGNARVEVRTYLEGSLETIENNLAISRTIIREVKTIASSRDVDPDKGQIEKIYAQLREKIQTDVLPKVNAQDSLREKIIEALSVVDPVEEETSLSPIEENFQKIKESQFKLQQIETMFERMKQDSQITPEEFRNRAKEMTEKLGELQTDAEDGFTTLQNILQQNKNQREKYKKLFDESKMVFTAFVKNRGALEAKIKKEVSGNATRKASTPVQRGNEGGADRAQMLEPRFYPLHEATVKLVNELTDFVEEPVEFRKRVSRLQGSVRLLAQMASKMGNEEKQMVRKIEEDLKNITMIVNPSSSEPTQKVNPRRNPEIAAQLGRLKAIYEEMLVIEKNLMKIKIAIENITDLEVSDPVQLQKRKEMLEANLQNARTSLSGIPVLKARFEKIKTEVKDSDNGEILNRMRATEQLFGRLNFEKQLGEMKSDATKFTSGEDRRMTEETRKLLIHHTMLVKNMEMNKMAAESQLSAELLKMREVHSKVRFQVGFLNNAPIGELTTFLNGSNPGELGNNITFPKSPNDISNMNDPVVLQDKLGALKSKRSSLEKIRGSVDTINFNRSFLNNPTTLSTGKDRALAILSKNQPLSKSFEQSTAESKTIIMNSGTLREEFFMLEKRAERCNIMAEKIKTDAERMALPYMLEIKSAKEYLLQNDPRIKEALSLMGIYRTKESLIVDLITRYSVRLSQIK